MLKKVLADLLPSQTALVAVSKTRSVDAILELYHQGQRVFGENRVQEMIEKHQLLPQDIAWHLIGHLQTNKVKYIASFVQMIHAVESLKLLQEINKQAIKNIRVIDVLLQFHIAEEDSKFGLDLQGARDILNSDFYKNAKNIKVRGVMGMATFTADQSQVRKEFQTLKSIFEKLKREFFQNKNDFKEISMGMSGDYKIAIEEGSTMVRVGSLLFNG